MSGHDVSVVLVHGAWADGSSWSKVIAPLAAEGRQVVAPSLPLTSLRDDAAAVERALERISGPVVLVGHAYGGAVVSAIRGDKVKALVYVAAGAPNEGETVLEAFYGAEPPKLEPDRHGAIHLPEPAFAAAFAPDATPAEQAVLAAVQRPISTDCITVPLARPLWRDVPAWFLVAERDRLLAPDRQLAMAQRMKARLHSVAADHAPLVSAPLAVLSVIREAIESVIIR
jgi:pimeloyl-ACP methyl ester carboxylesterase